MSSFIPRYKYSLVSVMCFTFFCVFATGWLLGTGHSSKMLSFTNKKTSFGLALIECGNLFQLVRTSKYVVLSINLVLSYLQ